MMRLPGRLRFIGSSLLLSLPLVGQTTLTYNHLDEVTTTLTPGTDYVLTIAGGVATEHGDLSGGGSLTKTGEGYVIIDGNVTNSGGINFQGGALRWGVGNTRDISGQINGLTAHAVFDTQGNDVTFASALVSANGHGFTKLSAGPLTLAADSAFTSTAGAVGPPITTGSNGANGGSIQLVGGTTVISGHFSATGGNGGDGGTNSSGVANGDGGFAGNGGAGGSISVGIGGTLNLSGSIDLRGGAGGVGGLTGLNDQPSGYVGQQGNGGSLSIDHGTLNWSSGTIDLGGYVDGSLSLDHSTLNLASATQLDSSLTGTVTTTNSIINVADTTTAAFDNARAVFATLSGSNQNTVNHAGSLNQSVNAVIDAGNVLSTSGSYTQTAGELSGSGTLHAASYSFQSGTVGVRLADAPDASAANFTKSGSGTMVLTNTNSYTGSTIVTDGLLLLSSPLSLNEDNVSTWSSLYVGAAGHIGIVASNS